MTGSSFVLQKMGTLKVSTESDFIRLVNIS